MILPRQMADNMDIIGQRADKQLVTGIVGPVEYTDKNGNRREGIAKEVEHYTVTCPACGSPGRYDEKGQIVCEDHECAVVISGDNQAVLPYEYSGEMDSTPGSSRGLGSLGDAEGTHEPRI